jgi:hypothetical protein
MDLLLPRTDGGVAIQAILAAMALLAALVAARHAPEVRPLVVGLATMTAALFGLRALH